MGTPCNLILGWPYVGWLMFFWGLWLRQYILFGERGWLGFPLSGNHARAPPQRAMVPVELWSGQVIHILHVLTLCVGDYLQVRIGSVHAAGSELPLSHSSPTASSRVGCWAHLSFPLLRSCWLGKLSSLPRWDPQLQSILVCAGCLRILTEDLCLCNKYSNHDMFNVLGIEGRNRT